MVFENWWMQARAWNTIFLFFNLNDLSKKNPPFEAKQTWFRNVNFRRAVSAIIDRQNIARLVYAGRAASIWTHITPGNKLWTTSSIAATLRSIESARSLIAAAGFSWDSERVLMATMIQQDLWQAGFAARVVSLEFRSLLDRIMSTFDYEACMLGLASGDADPGSENECVAVERQHTSLGSQ